MVLECILFGVQFSFLSVESITDQIRTIRDKIVNGYDVAEVEDTQGLDGIM